MTVYGSGYKSAASCAVSLMHLALFAFLQTVVNDCPFLQREVLCPSMPRVACRARMRLICADVLANMDRKCHEGLA